MGAFIARIIGATSLMVLAHFADTVGEALLLATLGIWLVWDYL